MRKGCFAAIAVLVSSAVSAELVVYPDYPHDRIQRDNFYTVKVAQENVVKPLTVWNHTEKSILLGRTRGGDVNRRFCEFAFSGAPVRVDFKVPAKIGCYAIFPSRLNLKHIYRDGVISVWLERPTRFGLRLDDYDKTIISVFADPPEDPATIPSKNDPKVIRVDGWMDATTTNGQLVVTNGIKQVYIAPGAVLNARLKIVGNNVLVNGRGMVLDPMSDIFRYNQNCATERGLLVTRGRNVEIRDIKLIDSRTFNFMFGSRNAKAYNVKALSAMMCTDGFTCSGTMSCEGAWLYVGDNGTVISWAKQCKLKDVAIGTSCAAIYPQGTFAAPVELEGIDVFRADDGVINNRYNGLYRPVKWDELTNKEVDKPKPAPETLSHHAFQMNFKNLSVVDCVHFPDLFNGRNMGTKPKVINFENVALTSPSGSRGDCTVRKENAPLFTVVNSAQYLYTTNYQMRVKNMYLNGELLENIDRSRVGATEDEMQVACETDGGRPEGLALKPMRFVVGEKVEFPVGGDLAVGGTNLVEETWPIRSVWQRHPSWLVKFDAVERDQQGNVVYRLTQAEKRSGMQAVITEGVLRQGNGKYRLRFDAKCDTKTKILAIFVSNDNYKVEKPIVLNNKDWATYETELDIKLPPGADLASIRLTVTAPTPELQFRNLNFSRQ